MVSILFWVAWVILALISGLILITGANPVRLGGFGILLLLPILAKKYLFKKFLPSLALWAGVYVAFMLIVGLSGIGGDKTSSRTIELLSRQTAGGVSVAVLNGVLPQGAQITVKADSAQLITLKDVTARSYEISLPAGATLAGVAEVRLPIDKSLVKSGLALGDAVTACYFDPAINNWVPTLYYIEGSEVVIVTDHLSRFGVLYFKDGRRALMESVPDFDTLPTLSYSTDELNRVITDISSSAAPSQTAFDKSWSEFTTYYNLTGASSTILQATTGSETLKNVNSIMNEVGMGFALSQLAFDIYKGDTTAAVTNFTKNSALYAASKWGSEAIGLAAAGATFIDISLNQYAEAALSKNLQKWEDAFRGYYETEPTAVRTAVGWYKIVKQVHASSTSAADFKAKLDKELDGYCKLFWDDPEGYARVAEATPGIIGFGAGGEYAQGVAELSARYKAYLYHTTMQPVMATLVKNLWYAEYMKASASFGRLKAEMNKRYTVTIVLQNAAAVSSLAGTNVKFLNTSGKVAHAQSFDASGKVTLNMTLFGFLKMGGPTKVEVNIKAQGNVASFSWTGSYKLDKTAVSLAVPYAPGQSPTTTTMPTAATKTLSEGQIGSQLRSAQITIKDLLSNVGWGLKADDIFSSSQSTNMPIGDVQSSVKWRASTGEYRAVDCTLYFMAGNDPTEDLWMSASSFRSSMIARKGGAPNVIVSSYNPLPGGVFEDHSSIDYNQQGVVVLYNFDCYIYFWVSPNYYGVVHYMTEGTANAAAAQATWRTDYARLSQLEYSRLAKVAGVTESVG
jgi:hypothetical protein